MTGWTDKRGPVFRSSPDRAWPLRRVSDRSGEAIETAQTGSTEGESAGPKDNAKTNVFSLKHRGVERLG